MLGASLLTVATLELLRAVLPGLLLVRTDTGQLPLPGAVAVAFVLLCASPLVAVPLVRWQPRATWLGAVVVVVGAHAVLLAAPAGTVLLLTAGAGTAAGLVGLVAVTATAGLGRAVRVGVLAGLAVEGLMRAATQGSGLVWSATPAAGAITVALLLALLVVAVPAISDRATGAQGAEVSGWSAAWLVPAVVLTLTVSGAGGRIAVATGWSPPEVAATSASALVLGVVAALLAPRFSPARAGPVGAALLLIGAAASLPAAGWSGVLGPIAVAIGLGVSAAIESPTPRGSALGGRILLPAVALAGAGAILLLHSLAVTLGLPGNTRPVLLLLTALGGAVLSGLANRAVRRPTVRAHLRPRPVLATVGTAAAAIGLVAVLATPARYPPPDTDRDPDHLTVATLEVRAGFGLDARFDPSRQAELLRAQGVDLVLLTGVDRGGWMTGGQDLLAVLSARLGLEHTVFAPAADAVTGNALVSRHPITEFVAQPLPGGRSGVAHSQLVAVVRLPDGEPLGVIGTQLVTDGQPEVRLPQVRAVAGSVARLRERQLPTVLLGDLGGPLDGSLLDTFTPLLHTAMPDGARTFPAGAPTRLRDHVLLSPQLRRSEIAIPVPPVSTHLPVVVTVERTDSP